MKHNSEIIIVGAHNNKKGEIHSGAVQMCKKCKKVIDPTVEIEKAIDKLEGAKKRLN